MRVLGSLSAEVDGKPVDLGAPRQRAVLSLLIAARGSVVSVDRLIDGLWQDVPPAKAMASLHVYVSRLRSSLEPDRPPRTPASILVTLAPGYALRLPPDAVDAWRFEAGVARARDAEPEEAGALLAEALRCWQGPAFAEHADADWAGPEVARLTALRAEAGELAVAADLRTGRVSKAALEAEALVGEHPLREEGWRLLALAQWACGRQAYALSTLRRATRTLREELGCEPSPELVKLEHAVLTQRLDVLRTATSAPERAGRDVLRTATSAPERAALRAGHTRSISSPAEEASRPHPVSAADRSRSLAVPDGARPPATTTDGPRPPATADTTRPRWHDLFVGRSAELRTAHSAANTARHGGATLLVTGEPGAGKSALIGQLVDRLRTEGWRVLIGRCPEYEGAPPAWAWVELLGELARDTPPARPEELAALLGESDNEAAPTADEAASGRFRMHRAFVEWMRAAAGASPLAVVVEDLHRADSETLALVEVAASVTGVPLLTVGTYRPAEAGQHLVKTLAQLAPGVPHRITLGGLPSRDVATVVEAVCGEGVGHATLSALAERTGGNPFYVLESARLLASEGALVAVSEVPQGVRDVLRRRLALLPDSARTAVQLTAVVGIEAEVTVLAAAAEVPESDLLEGLDAALVANLLVEPRPGRVRFIHALVRDTVYTDLSGVRRSRLHARTAEVLRRHRPDDLAALAHHFARSGDIADAPLAVDYALRAAEAAARRYAHEVAVELIEQAIDTHTTAAAPGAAEEQPEHMVGLLVRLLGAQVSAGSTDAARHTRKRAIELAEQAGRGDLVAAVYGAWAEPSSWHSRLAVPDDPAVLKRIDELACDPDLDDRSRAGVLHALVDAVAVKDPPRAAEAARAQLQLARAGGDPRLLAAALMTSAKLFPHELHGAERTPLVAELRDLARTHDLPAYRWICEHLDSLTAIAGNDPAAVNRYTAHALTLAKRYRMVWAQGINTATKAMLAAVHGRFDEAEAQYAEADVLLQRVGTHQAQGMRTLGVSTIRLAQGRPADIEPMMRDVYDAVGAPVGVLYALILALLGRHDDARAVRLPEKPVTDHLYGIELDFRSQLAVLQGDLESAAGLVEHLLPLRGQFAAAAAVYATRPLDHALADLYLLLGEQQKAARHYAAAERTARTWNSPHCAEAAHRALAKLADQHGQRRNLLL
ncbi:BTAD domain-containing putative transcriptional regulator [Streptomyces sp. NPDC057280]|uniref:BTAD domain-containing putative transcriptional regulator n=1 Tax=Streptomyces sp. NPDC057280 TaxID=3346081 RepID=UPI0036419C32